MTRSLSIVEARTAADLDAVRALCWEYRDFLLSLDSPDREIVLRAFPSETYTRILARLAEDCAPPQGCVKLARIVGRPVGCGMALTLGPGTAEIKRVYVRPEARGTGAGRALMLALIQTCRAQGFKRILMDTGKPLVAAERLYRALGFRTRGPYSDLPPEVAERMIFFEMDL